MRLLIEFAQYCYDLWERLRDMLEQAFDSACEVILYGCMAVVITVTLPILVPVFIFWYLFVKEDDNNEH